MARHAAWAALDADLDDVPGTVSVFCSSLRSGGTPAYTRAAAATHYAASTMKVAVLAALHRGDFDLDRSLLVRNEFVSAAGGEAFTCQQTYDSDDLVWDRLGDLVPLGWLAERMIVRSSNLATNLVMTEVGLPAVAAVWDDVGAHNSVVGRLIEDSVAADAGISNLVTAEDLATLLSAIALGAESSGRLAPPAECRAMLDTLLSQEVVEDLAAGLPVGTRVAHKNGWVRGVRHGAGVVFPDDAPPFALAVCTTTPWAVNGHNDGACQLVAAIARTAWTTRQTL
jgi:beta-lactamase class A